MEWTVKSTSQLIKQFRGHPALWDPSCADYKNRIKKLDAWRQIAEQLGTNSAEVERKMRMLIGQFQRACKNGRIGDGPHAPYKTKWRFFNKLFFLKSRKQPRRSAGDHKREEESHDNMESCETTSEHLTDAFMDTTRKQGLNEIRPRDIYDLYGEYIAVSLRSMRNKSIVAVAKHEISSVIYRAELQDITSMAIATTSRCVTPGVSNETQSTHELDEVEIKFSHSDGLFEG